MKDWNEFLRGQIGYIVHDVAWFKEVCSRSENLDLFEELRNDLNSELLR